MPNFAHYATVLDTVKVVVNCSNCLNKGECPFYPDDNISESNRRTSTIIGPVELEISLDNSVAKRVLFGDCNKLKDIDPDKHHVAIDIGGLTVADVIEKVRDPGIETVTMPINDARDTEVIPKIFVELTQAVLSAGETEDL